MLSDAEKASIEDDRRQLEDDSRFQNDSDALAVRTQMRDELYQADWEYALHLNTVGTIIDQIEEAKQAGGSPDDEDGDWSIPPEEGGIDGGAALLKFAERLNREKNYSISPEEIEFINYQKTVADVVAARASIDQEKIMAAYPHDTLSESLRDKIEANRDLHLTRAAQAENGTLPAGFNGNADYFGSVAHQEGVAKRYLQDGSEFIDHGNALLAVIDAKRENPNNPAVAEAYENALRDAQAAGKVNEAVATAYTEVGLTREFRNEDYRSPAILARETATTEDTNNGNGATTPATRQSGRTRQQQGARTPHGQGSSGQGSGRQTSRQPSGRSPQGQSQGRQRTGGSGGQSPAGSPNNQNSGGGTPEANVAQDETAEQNEIYRMMLEGQKIRVANAATLLADNGRGRSRFEGFDEGDVHVNFRTEIYKLMRLEHPEYFKLAGTLTNKDDFKALTAHTNAYVAAQYNLVTQQTVEGMAGETDLKKRAKYNRVICMGAAAVGFVAGGPPGAALAGATALGITKALDHEVKGRKQLRGAIKGEHTQVVTDQYIDNLSDERAFTIEGAFAAATFNLRDQYERGVVKARRKRIGDATVVGGSWFLLSYVGIHQATEAVSYTFGLGGNGNIGGELRHWVSTLDNPMGPPGYDYTPGHKPFSLGLMQWLFDNPGVAVGTAATTAAAGAAVVTSRRRASAQNAPRSNNFGPNNQGDGGDGPRPRRTLQSV